MAETTTAGHLAHLRAALSWAKRIGLLAKVPEFEMPKRVKGKSAMRGYPIAGEQFERMLAAATKVRPKDAEIWRFYLRGLWLSGLRLGESLVLSWDREATVSIDLTGRHPRMRIDAEAEKGNKHRLLPITPDFAELLLAVPVLERRGRVFKLDGLETHEPISLKRVGRIVSAIGKKAGVVVNRDAKPYKRPGKPRKGKRAQAVEVAAHPGKFGSAHDLRRAFGTRWASKVKPATLRALMRHESIETTLKYYVALDADDVADELWKEYGPKEVASDKPKIDA